MRFTTISLALLVVSLGSNCPAADSPLPIITKVEQQPLVSQVERLVEALEYLGTPLSKPDRDSLQAAMTDSNAEKAVAGIQKVLDPHCLLGVELKSDKEVTVQAGSVKKQLVEQGWNQFLVKVHNSAELTGGLRATSPNAQRLAGSPKNDVSNTTAHFS